MRFILFQFPFIAQTLNVLTLHILLLLLEDELALLVLLFLLLIVLNVLKFLKAYVPFLQPLAIIVNELALFQAVKFVALILLLLLEVDAVLRTLIDADVPIQVICVILLRLLPFFSFFSFSFFLDLPCFINRKKSFHLHLFMLKIINFIIANFNLTFLLFILISDNFVTFFKFFIFLFLRRHYFLQIFIDLVLFLLNPLNHLKGHLVLFNYFIYSNFLQESKIII